MAASAAPAVGAAGQRLVYIYSEPHHRILGLLKPNKQRDQALYRLLQVCGLLPHISIQAPAPASMEQLLEFHDAQYLSALQVAGTGGASTDAESSASFGLCDDCPPWKGLWDYCRVVAGGTLSAVRALQAGAQCAVHFGGGRHHAGRASASGFCYVNDVVLGAMALRHHFGGVLVVDIDVHHGDGTEAAFHGDPSIATLSLHRHGPGFFPATGGADTSDASAGVFNVPYNGGISDAAFQRLFDAALHSVWAATRPAAVVLVAGVDALARDPSQGGNLSSAAFVHVMTVLREKCQPPTPTAAPSKPKARPPPTFASTAPAPAPAKMPAPAFTAPAPMPVSGLKPGASSGGIPLLVLGGGGYAPGASALTMASMVASWVGQSLPPRVPEHELQGLYAPTYKTSVQAKVTVEDENLRQGGASLARTLAQLEAAVSGYAAPPCRPAAGPSVLLQVPQRAGRGAKRPCPAPSSHTVATKAARGGGVRSRFRRRAGGSAGV